MAQNLDSDSLKRLLPLAKEKDRLVILNELGTNLREKDQDLALQYLIEAEKIAIAIGDKKGESKSKESISWIYYRRGQWQLSFDYAEEAYQLAMETSGFLEAARVLNNLGALYYEQQNYNMAISKFKEAFQLSLKENDLYTQIRSLNNVAYNFTLLHEYDSALTYAYKTLDINKKAGSPYYTAFTFRVIGDVFLERNQLDSAAVTFEKSLEMADKQGVLTFKASLFHRMGNTYLKQGRLEKAESILKDGITLSSENKFLDELQKSHRVLAKVFEAKGDIQSAFLEQSKYLALRDSLMSEETKNRLSLLQGMFENDLKRSELELLKAQNENQAVRINFIVRTVWVISIAGLLILALGIWLFRLNRKTRQQNRELATKSIELEEINQTKNKLFSIIGHDLRGPVGQVKSIVDLLIAGYLNKEEFDELIQNLKKDVDSVFLTLNNTLKWSLTQMDGFKVDQRDIDLKEVVDLSINAVQAQLTEKNIRINMVVEHESKVFADIDLMEIVLRNIFNNSIKYSKPGDDVLVTSELKDQMVNLCIKDNGTGMNKNQIDQILSENIAITDSSLGTQFEKGTGLGLQICKEFVKMNGGELSIQSDPGEGTKVCLRFQAA